MSNWVHGLMLLMLLVFGPGFSFAKSPAPTLDRHRSLIFQYLDTADSDEANRLLQTILSHADASIETVSRITQTERAYQSQPIGTLLDERIQIQGRDYPLSLSIPLTYQPSQRYGLVVCLHGAGFTGDVYLKRWQTRLGDIYLLACPTYPSGAWFTSRAEGLVLATIQHARRRYHVDPDRIFLTGMSNGGIGAWLIGMHHAPLFAGIAPMACGLDDVLLPFLTNLRHTPIYIIHGTKDQVMPVELSRTISRELTTLGYPHIYREHQREHPMAGGHYFPMEELPDLVAWFNGQRREPLPARLTVVREASHYQPFNWLRLDSTDPIAVFSDDLVDTRDERIQRREYAKLDAAIVAMNCIVVKAEHVQRYSLFLNDKLIDLSKPLMVVTNGQVSFEGLVTLSLETLLRQARMRHDPRQLFPIHLTIMVQKQMS